MRLHALGLCLLLACADKGPRPAVQPGPRAVTPTPLPAELGTLPVAHAVAPLPASKAFIAIAADGRLQAGRWQWPIDAAGLRAAEPTSLGMVETELTAVIDGPQAAAPPEAGRPPPGTLGHVTGYGHLGTAIGGGCATLTAAREAAIDVVILADQSGSADQLFHVLHAVTSGTAIGVLAGGEVKAHRLLWNSGACEGAPGEGAQIQLLPGGGVSIDGTEVMLGDPKLPAILAADPRMKQGRVDLVAASFESLTPRGMARITVGHLLAFFDALIDAGMRELRVALLDDFDAAVAPAVAIEQLASEPGRAVLDLERTMDRSALPALERCLAGLSPPPTGGFIEVAFHVDPAGKVGQVQAQIDVVDDSKDFHKAPPAAPVLDCLTRTLTATSFGAGKDTTGVSLVLEVSPRALGEK